MVRGSALCSASHLEIAIDGDVVWDRRRDGGFPDVKTLKQLVRDRLDPERDLGHIDRAAGEP